MKDQTYAITGDSAGYFLHLYGKTKTDRVKIRLEAIAYRSGFDLTLKGKILGWCKEQLDRETGEPHTLCWSCFAWFSPKGERRGCNHLLCGSGDTENNWSGPNST